MRSPEAVITKCFSWKTKYILMALVAFVLSTCEGNLDKFARLQNSTFITKSSKLRKH